MKVAVGVWTAVAEGVVTTVAVADGTAVLDSTEGAAVAVEWTVNGCCGCGVEEG